MGIGQLSMIELFIIAIPLLVIALLLARSRRK